MKKNFSIIISMMIFAFLAIGCGKKFESKITPIKGTEFAFFTGQDVAKKTVFGIKKSETVVIPAIYSNIVHSSNYFAVTKGTEFFLLDGNGKEAILGAFTSCEFEKNPLDSLQTYFALEKADGKYIFLPKEKISFGPLADFVLNKDLFFGKLGDKWGIQNLKNEPILPAEFSEIIVVKDEKTSANFFLAKDAKDWVLYDASGKKMKKVPSYNLNQTLKSAKDKWGDGSITGLSVVNVKKI